MLRGWKIGSCTSCGNFQTGHKCRMCKLLCCNLCNKSSAEELTDIMCPKCYVHGKVMDNNDLQDEFLDKSDVQDEFHDNTYVQDDVLGAGTSTDKRSRGRPHKLIPTGKVLIPLFKKKRGIVSTNPEAVEEGKPKRSRGRPSIASTETTFVEGSSGESEEETDDKPREVRILGKGNILTKVFVDEALTCNKPMETHVYDVVLATEKPLPCFYCGEVDPAKISLDLTEDKFPLCRKCEESGRGAAPRRKSRKLIPKAVKVPLPKKSKEKKAQKKPLI